jgi:valyl-tRNA synthetase
MATTLSLKAIPDRFDFAQAEARVYRFWEACGYFHSEPDPARKPFSMVIPPPNVTGALHLGHALNNTLQDVLARMRRMQGYNTLWMPGTDHAGIGTQAVVERRLLEEEGKTRHDLGRQALVQRIWSWKEQYEQRILSQLKQIGSSCDWQRTRFTLDPICARAVRRTFFDLFRKQLIYRGKRLVNWDTFLQTAVSDDEVFHDTIQGNFWHFHYPVIDPAPGEPTHVTIATTRPETMLGDTAVAVHPHPAKALGDAEAELRARLAAAPAREQPEIQNQIEAIAERRQGSLALLEQLRDMARDGRQLMLPLVNRPIPLIVDPWAKPELGTGCVKITPAHDPNDYEVGLRQKLPMINILQPDGTLNANAGKYRGLAVLEARKQVVRDMEVLGLLGEIEDRLIDLAHSDRSKTPIEPYLTNQWFVRMEQLAQMAMDAVNEGRIEFFPPRYAKGYLDWLAEKRDWPVSRQLWWGHQIPIWSRACPDQATSRRLLAELEKDPRVAEGRVAYQVEYGQTDQTSDGDAGAGQPWATIHVCIQEEDAALEAHYTQRDYRRVEDVLDTWFSSALWPHSTLGWPEQTPELAYYYPTSTLITSRDIITLWVARMVLTGLNNTGKVPFRHVFVHPKILDRYGETMSKSKGNGVDPLDVIEKFGADALRFGLTYLATETQDVRMPVQFECPHCAALIEQTRENRELPRVTCTSCQKAFRTQWASKPEDTALRRGIVVSERFELGRNFVNKLWNASRFALMNLDDYVPGPVGQGELLLEDRWILSRLASVTQQVTECMESYRYAEAVRSAYDFAWDQFCSFYLEMLKQRLGDPSGRAIAQRMLAHTLDTLLRLLHPVIPFVTEEVWQLLGQAAPQRGLPNGSVAAPSVMVAPWPQRNQADHDVEIEAQFRQFQAVLGALREIRSRQGISPKREIEFCVVCEEPVSRLLAPMQAYFVSMAKARSAGWGRSASPPPTHAKESLPGMEIYVDLRDLIDVDAEISRNEKQRTELRAMIEGKQNKLANANFVGRAPAEVVQRERASLDELQERLKSIESALMALRSRQ